MGNSTKRYFIHNDIVDTNKNKRYEVTKAKDKMAFCFICCWCSSGTEWFCAKELYVDRTNDDSILHYFAHKNGKYEYTYSVDYKVVENMTGRHINKYDKEIYIRRDIKYENQRIMNDHIGEWIVDDEDQQDLIQNSEQKSGDC